MKFPGSKRLYEVDLALRKVSLADLARSSEQVGLTGLAELRFGGAVGMMFFYLGAAVNAQFRDAKEGYHGGEALARIGERLGVAEGSLVVYELPLDLAHLLRGLSRRRRLETRLGSGADLARLLEALEGDQHTGTLEVQTAAGAGLLLLVNGRVSNVYWETPDGLTHEMGEGRRRLDSTLDASGGEALLSEFSQEVWRARDEVQGFLREAGSIAEGSAPEEAAAQEQALRESLVREIDEHVPAMVQALVFDLPTGAILARRVRGSASMRHGFLPDRIPVVARMVRDIVASEQRDEVELVELSTTRAEMMIALVPSTLEGVGLLADRSQPTAQLAAILLRLVRGYAAQRS
jgi:hypothetical protein